MLLNETFSLNKLGFFCIFVILFFSVFFQANQLTSEFITAFYPTVFIFCMMAFFLMPVSLEIKIKHKNIVITLILFIIINFLSVFWSVYPAQSLWEASKLLIYFFIFIISSQILTEKNIVKMIQIMLLIGVFEVFQPIYDFLIIRKAAFTLTNYYGRAMGTFPGPNAYGIYLAMIFLMAVGLLVKKQSRRDLIIYSLMMAILICGMILSGSRGVWISFIVSILLFFLWTRLSYKKHLLILFIMAVGVMIALLIIKISFLSDGAVESASTSISGRSPSSAVINRIQISPEKVSSLNSRTPIWKAAVDMCLSKPLTGYGLGTFERIYGTFQVDLREYPNYAHNQYLQVFAETGVFTFIIFLLFSFYNMRSVYGARKTRNSLTIGFAAAVTVFSLHIIMDFDWNFFAVTCLFFFVLGGLYKGLNQKEMANIWLISYSKNKKRLILSAVFLLGILIALQLANHYEINQGNKALAKGDFAPAKEKASTAAMILPIDPHAYMLQAYLSLNDGTPDLKESILYTRKAIKVDSNNAWNYNQLGLLLLHSGDSKAALENLRKSLSLNRSELKLYLDLGKALVTCNKLDEAEVVLICGYKQRGNVPKYFFDHTKDEVTKQTIEIGAELIKIYSRKDPAKAVKMRKDIIEEYPASISLLDNLLSSTNKD